MNENLDHSQYELRGADFGPEPDAFKEQFLGSGRLGEQRGATGTVATVLTALALLAGGGGGGPSPSRVETMVRPTPASAPPSGGIEIEVGFKNGGRLYCRDDQPVGFQYGPPGSATGSGPGSCDVFYSSDQLAYIIFNGQLMIIPDVSEGVNPSRLAP